MLLLLLACTGGTEPADTGSPRDLDDTLTLDRIQAVGTHNSYHIDTSDFPPWDYDHRPLDEQLDLGVRQFELDLYDVDGVIEVLHVPGLDAGTTCETLAECVQTQADWSAAHPDHVPFVTLIEPKSSNLDAAFYDALDAILREAWGEALFEPSELLGEHADLPTALATDGWPTFATHRGTGIYVLHARNPDRDVYLQAGLETRAMFPDGYGDLDAPWAAIHSMNDPADPRIAEVLAAGHLVRTRTDSDVVEPAAGDTTRRDTAIASGAHFLSTDFPEPHPETGYVVDLGGVVCNPVTAGDGCDPDRIE